MNLNGCRIFFLLDIFPKFDSRILRPTSRWNVFVQEANAVALHTLRIWMLRVDKTEIISRVFGRHFQKKMLYAIM